jgi:hypothetical protein
MLQGRTPAAFMMAAVLTLSSGGIGMATSKPISPDTRSLPPLRVEQVDLQSAPTKDTSQKRLRMRQVLLLWLLANQPSK